MTAEPLGHNIRYVLYARAHGRDVDDMLEHDRTVWPGGVMAGFLIWHNERLREGSRQVPAAFYMGGLIDHAAYDGWLAERVDELLMVEAAALATELLSSEELDQLERESMK